MTLEEGLDEGCFFIVDGSMYKDMLYCGDNRPVIQPSLFIDNGDRYQGKNRVGITENLYMQGHWQLWDNIIKYCKEHGKCPYVDSCACGGGRNDLETARRSIPFG